MDISDEVLKEKTFNKLCLAAEYYKSLNPVISRHYALEAAQINHDLGKFNISWAQCKSCGCVFEPNNYSVRFVPRPKIDKRLRRFARNGRQKVSGILAHLKDLYYRQECRVVYKCHMCQGKSSHRLVAQKVREKMRCYTMRSDNQNQKAYSGKEKIAISSKKALASPKSATRKSGVPTQPIAGSKAQLSGSAKKSTLEKTVTESQKKINTPKSVAVTQTPLRHGSMLPVTDNTPTPTHTNKMSNKKSRNKVSNRLLSNVLSREANRGANQSPSLMNFLSSL